MGVSFWRNYLGAVIADKMVLAASRVAGAIRLSILVGSCCASSLAHSAHGDGAGSQGHPDLPCRRHADGAFQDRCWFVGISESDAWMGAGSLRQIWVVVPADD